MTWQIIVLISIGAITTSRLLQKGLVKANEENPVGYSIIFQIITALLILFFAITQGFNLEGYASYIPFMAVSALAYAGGNAFLFNAFKKADASSVIIYFSTTAMWSSLFSIVFLSEAVTSNKILGVGLIVTSIITINIKKGIQRPGKYELFALAAAILFGIGFTSDAYIVGDRHAPSYLFLAFLFPGILTGFIFPKSVKPAIQIVKKIPALFNTALVAFFYAISTITLFLAYQEGGEASIISPMHQTSTLLIVILSIFLFQEKDRMLQKFSAALLGVIGAMILAA